MSKNKKEVLNNPFVALKQLLPKQPAPISQQVEQAPQPAAPVLDEMELFEQAMYGVEELDKAGRTVPLQDQRVVPEFIPVNDELEVMAHLSELVAGQANMNISWQKDFVRGSSQGINPQLLELLEAGRFPVQDYLDLHGLGPDEALKQVEGFLQQSRSRGLRHVLIVHGKGKGSRGGESVLKETLSRSLGHKRFARWVLAFCSARQRDGGTGALYVLLKTWQSPTMFVKRKSTF